MVGWLKEVDRSAFQSMGQSVLRLEMRNSQALKENRDFARADEPDPVPSGDWGRFARPMEVTIDKRPCSSITPDQGNAPTI